MLDTKEVTDILEKVIDVTKKPEKFLSVQDGKAEKIKILTKELYDYCKLREDPGKNFKDTLQSLIIQDFDEEQIWQEIDLQNKAVYDTLVRDVAYLFVKKDKLIFSSGSGVNPNFTLEDIGNEDDEFDEDNDGSDNENGDDEELNEGSIEGNSYTEGLKDIGDVEEDEYEDEELLEEKEFLEESKSSFQKRQERLKSKIKELEENALKEKPWQMKGEVTGNLRPENSLLENYVEFDVASRPAPVITEQTTLKLEDIIKQRIKDKVWDDVVRKIKLIEDPKEYRKRLVLDQEKSKLSLAEIYEQEFIKQRDASKSDDVFEKPDEEVPEHVEIKKIMKGLFSKLDALSNFHYTPKQAVPEIKIISNLPAINIEEVAPTATSDAMLLAPEEVKSKVKGDLIGKTERSETDKKRERRKKKLKQKLRQKEKEKREKLVSKLQPGLGNKYSKEKAKKMLEKVMKESNVSQIEEKESEGKYVKSSNAFFSKLQDEVTSHIKKTSKAKKFKSEKKFSAKKLKL